MNSSELRQSRKQIYLVLIVIALSIVAGRIATVISREGDTAFLSANDRSRWCTITSLVELRTYQIDKLIDFQNKKRRRPWYTIDLVRHRAQDGELHYYSSKPPLFPTMVAGVYWTAYQVTGMQISRQPIYMTRIVLALVNLPLLAIFYFCVIRSIERVGRGHWSRITAAAATCFGTMMMPFAVALNNHLVAATSGAVVICIYLSAVFGSLGDDDEDEDDDYLDVDVKSRRLPWWKWLIAGLAGAFCVANELPALSMLALWFLLVLIQDRRAILSFSAGVLIVAAGFFATNYLAHGSLKPPYMHRGLGDEIATVSSSTPLTASQVKEALFAQSVEFDASKLPLITKSGEEKRWIAQTADNRLFAITSMDGDQWRINHWDDWYDYPRSYWRGDRRQGVDLGEESRAVYLMNMTVGHYGIFSITPYWLLVPFGLITGVFWGPPGYRRLAFAVLTASAVCMVFYVMRPKIDRNYGGVSSCFRWMLWFAPFWLVMVTRVIDWCGKRAWSRGLVILLLAFSCFSMAVSLPSPWIHPWIYRFWSFLGWIGA